MVHAVFMEQLLPPDRDRLVECLRAAAREGRPCCLIAARLDWGASQTPWGRELPPGAVQIRIGRHRLVVALPGHRIDKACALAERLARLQQARGVTVHMGVAEALSRCFELEPLLGRAEEALRLATEGRVGSVVSMNWADVSQDLGTP
ncbi:MAG TPA: hypothetical protein RMG48_05990 [Myxococcales bacterium LLY-WYZ-16_1]|jgi:hypothetical protein|nr:hypothetical protein [Myxococcales bacterium LLY-WYZ-16_1]